MRGSSGNGKYHGRGNHSYRGFHGGSPSDRGYYQPPYYNSSPTPGRGGVTSYGSRGVPSSAGNSTVPYYTSSRAYGEYPSCGQPPQQQQAPSTPVSADTNGPPRPSSDNDWPGYNRTFNSRGRGSYRGSYSRGRGRGRSGWGRPTGGYYGNIGLINGGLKSSFEYNPTDNEQEYYSYKREGFENGYELQAEQQHERRPSQHQAHHKQLQQQDAPAQHASQSQPYQPLKPHSSSQNQSGHGYHTEGSDSSLKIPIQNGNDSHPIKRDASDKSETASVHTVNPETALAINNKDLEMQRVRERLQEAEFTEKHWISRIHVHGDMRKFLSRAFDSLDVANASLLNIGARRAELEIDVERYNRLLKAEDERVRLAEEKLEAMDLDV